MARMADDARALGMDVALWGLDAVSARLAPLTLGAGPGPRLELLNRLHDALGARLRGALVVCDDDVVFSRGGLALLLAGAAACNFGIAQPAHAPGSHVSHPFTATRPLTLARQTTFVEVGPMVVIDAAWRRRVFPLPVEFGMGWGLDVVWHGLVREGCRLGIVDAVTIEHLGPIAGDYDRGPERRRLSDLLRAHGIEGLEQIQRSVGAWRAWRRRPSWRAFEPTDGREVGRLP